MSRAIRIGILLFPAVLAWASGACAQCVGDCDGNGTVAINELILGVNIALDSTSVSACPAFDPDDSGTVTISKLIAGVNNALSGCPPTPTGTATGSVTSTVAASATASHTATTTRTATATVATGTATATLTVPPSPTVSATPVASPSITSTQTGVASATATATPSATDTLAATDTPGTPSTPNATATASPNESETATGTASLGATATATTAVSTATATANVTDTPTPTSTPMPSTQTPTPTMMPAVCGNGFLEAGETCESCAADCTVLACTATTPIQTLRVNFETPIGTAPTVVSALVGYRSNRVSLPNSGTGARVKMRPTGSQQLVTDLNYALRVVLNAMVGTSIPSGKLFTIDFDSCQGQSAVTPADFGCQIESCGSSAGPIEGCKCSVVLP